MIKNTKYIISKQFNPYINLAIEEYLFHHIKEGECILFLWQNEKTVVIGKNQNPWKECRNAELERDGGYLVRRLSGGGAVFHDFGNLNFTFLVQKPDYNVEKQLEVIIQALRNMGIIAKKSGRNDITIEGRKFSGNAFYTDGIHCYHHGTILVHVNMEDLSKYLKVSREKLISKGVSSVKSRVTNLIDYKKDLTIETMKKELIQAFEKVYVCTPQKMELDTIDHKGLKVLTDKFSSWNFIYGKRIPFTYEIEKRFQWGGVDIQLQIDEGKIKECVIYSDAMDTNLLEKIPSSLKNYPFHSQTMVMTLKKIKPQLYEQQVILNDLCELIMEENI